MPIQEKFWILALLAACIYAAHVLLVTQLGITVLHLQVFALAQKPVYMALCIVFCVSFMSAKWRVANWKEMAIGIVVVLLYDPFLSQHYPAEVLQVLFSVLDPASGVSVLNMVIAPIVIATLAGFLLYNWADKIAERNGRYL